MKELLENAIDAGSTNIKLIIKDAGKSLIQIIDNGCGMSETDARMCFERHATSKIRQAKDLFAIRTMGFRGEAMASIAAIAHVELKTRKHADELGTRIVVEGSEVKTQEACQCAAGTACFSRGSARGWSDERWGFRRFVAVIARRHRSIRIDSS